MAENSKLAKIFYGKHFYPGVAEYRDTNTRVLIKEDAIRNMNPTFAGRPVFVGHVGDEIDNLSLDQIKEIQDGYVIRSFFNEADGATWVEFLVDSEKGLDAIAKGLKLSNAYEKKTTDPRHGLYSGQDYDEEILSGTFHHLAIVENPRYSDSIILTPEQFKTYNEEKRATLALQNSLDKEKSKLESKMPFNFFKKSKVPEGGLDLEGYSVMLKNRGEVFLTDLIKEADVELKEIKDQIITINEDEHMTIDEAVKEINALRSKCNELEEQLKGKAENEDEKKDEPKKENEDAKDEKKDNADGEPAKENACDKKNEDEAKKENEDEKKDDDKKENTSEEEKEKKLEETEKKTEELVKKNFLNEVLNAKQICANDVGRQDILLPADRAELAKKLF